MLDAFDANGMAAIEAVNADFECPDPTPRQTVPHPKGAAAYAACVKARLGAWTGHCGKPGPGILNRGMQRFTAIKFGVELNAGIA